MSILDAYLDDRANRPSIASMREAWKAAKPFWGAYRPDQITRPLCRDYIALRGRQGVKPGTIIKEMGTIRAAVNWADKNNKAVFEFPPQPAPRDRWISKDDARRLLASAQQPHMFLFIHLAIATAGRAEAILELTWDRVDFDRRLIVLESERRSGKKRATVPMTHTVAWPLALAHSIRVSDHVIEYGGKPVKSVSKGFSTAARAAGLSDISPHILRHSAASWMVMGGIPIEEVARYLGHLDPRVSWKVYGKFSPGYLGKAKEALEL